MANKKKQQEKKPPTPDLQEKPLNPDEDRANIKASIVRETQKAKETLRLKIIAENMVLRKAGIGVGDTRQYVEHFNEGFKAVFSARGLRVPEEWEKEGAYGDKKQAPRMSPASKHYGVVPGDSRKPKPNKNNRS